MDNSMIYYLKIDNVYQICSCHNKLFYIKQTWTTIRGSTAYRLSCTRCRFCFNTYNPHWLHPSETRVIWITI